MQRTPKFRFDHTKLTVSSIFYEETGTRLLKFQVVEEPTLDCEGDDGKYRLRWKGKYLSGVDHLEAGDIIDFLITESYEHYGPRIHLEA